MLIGDLPIYEGVPVPVTGKTGLQAKLTVTCVWEASIGWNRTWVSSGATPNLEEGTMCNSSYDKMLSLCNLQTHWFMRKLFNFIIIHFLFKGLPIFTNLPKVVSVLFQLLSYAEKSFLFNQLYHCNLHFMPRTESNYKRLQQCCFSWAHFILAMKVVQNYNWTSSFWFDIHCNHSVIPRVWWNVEGVIEVF